MESKGRDKAAYRLLMKDAASKKEKRIDSPLVRFVPAPLDTNVRSLTFFNRYRYNDVGQPVCKVCNVSLKSEALWNAHIAGKPHKEVKV